MSDFSNVSAEDVENVKGYAKAFGVEIPADLDIALAALEANKTDETAEAMQLELCKWIVTTTHESFNDPIWEMPKKSAREVLAKAGIIL